MTIQLEMYQLLMLIGSVIAAFWALAKMIIRQAQASISEKFEGITQHLNAQDEKVDSLQKELSEHRIELARDYVRREDYVQAIGSIMIKIDSLALRVENKLMELFKEFKPK